MDLGFDGVHALVTGASGGIGFAITQLFLISHSCLTTHQWEHGARVTAQYNAGPSPLTKAKASSDRLEIVQADVTQERATKEMFERGADSFNQKVQVLIYEHAFCLVNHGIFPAEDVDLVDMDLSQWQRTVDVNLTGSFLTARKFLRRLRKTREGYALDMSKVVIVVMGSTSGDFGGGSHYACTKSALQVGLIRTLKNEISKIAPAGRVNAVSPGWVNTSMAQSVFANEALMKRTLAATPLGRIATTMDVATQTLILASSTASAHVTGTNVVLAGGLDGRVLLDSI
ncbi:NAD(P)-binding protein [Ceratobasidium sp. AG-I]|nr:NAD(P)-binding protein [Ceratobasidium sp. AG-I]